MACFTQPRYFFPHWEPVHRLLIHVHLITEQTISRVYFKRNISGKTKSFSYMYVYFQLLNHFCVIECNTIIIIQLASRYEDNSDGTRTSCKTTQYKSGSTRGRSSPRPQSNSRSLPRPKSPVHSPPAKKSSGDRDRFISTAERVNTVFEANSLRCSSSSLFLI